MVSFGVAVVALSRTNSNAEPTTGFVGVGYLLPALSSAGHADVAHRLLAQRTFPS